MINYFNNIIAPTNCNAKIHFDVDETFVWGLFLNIKTPCYTF